MENTTIELTNEQKRENAIRQRNELIKEKAIELILGQTDYTREEAILYLNENNNDPIMVIKKFMGINSEEIKQKKEKELNMKSKNQKKYTIIRDYMDDAANKYLIRKEQAKAYEEFMEKRKEYIERLKKQQDQRNEDIENTIITKSESTDCENTTDNEK